ncbi:MAG: hypothetical protein WDM81_16090, partial [Rhizomicrobium sp.]
MIQAVIGISAASSRPRPSSLRALRKRARHSRRHDPQDQLDRSDPETNAWAQFEQSLVDMDGFDRLFLAEAAVLGHTIRAATSFRCCQGIFVPT